MLLAKDLSVKTWIQVEFPSSQDLQVYKFSSTYDNSSLKVTHLALDLLSLECWFSLHTVIYVLQFKAKIYYFRNNFSITQQKILGIYQN